MCEGLVKTRLESRRIYNSVMTNTLPLHPTVELQLGVGNPEVRRLNKFPFDLRSQGTIIKLAEEPNGALLQVKLIN